MALGRFDEAIESYQKALTFQPNYARAHNNLGLVYVGLGKLDDAVSCYLKALDLKPDYAEAHSNLGATLNMIGKRSDAIIHFKKSSYGFLNFRTTSIFIFAFTCSIA